MKKSITALLVGLALIAGSLLAATPANAVWGSGAKILPGSVCVTVQDMADNRIRACSGVYIHHAKAVFTPPYQCLNIGGYIRCGGTNKAGKWWTLPSPITYNITSQYA